MEGAFASIHIPRVGFVRALLLGDQAASIHPITDELASFAPFAVCFHGAPHDERLEPI
jgi:hypothetical protein